MSNPFARKTKSAPGSVLDRAMEPGHTIESDFCTSKCRFVLECSCGAAHETRYIDEALEWSAMHRELAPLADQLANTTPAHD